MVPKVAGSKSSRFAEIRGSVAEASRDVAGFFSASRKRRGASRGQTYYPFGVLVDRNKPNGKKSALSHLEIPLMEHFPEQNTHTLAFGKNFILLSSSLIGLIQT